MTEQEKFIKQARLARKALASLILDTASIPGIDDRNDPEVAEWIDRLAAARHALENLAERVEG
jgi:hypothetical protein